MTTEQSNKLDEIYNLVKAEKQVHMVTIGSYNSASSHNIDVKDKIENYKDLTIANFYLNNVKVQWSSGSALPDSANNAPILSSYDESTGILYLRVSGSYSGGNGYIYYANYTIVAIY